MTAILGISAFYHDSAAALVVDGRIVAAAQEERFTRKKHDPDFPHNAVDYCLREAGITAADLDYVGFYDKPITKFERLLETYLAMAPGGYRSFRQAMPVWLKEKLYVPAADPQGARRQVSRPLRLHRSPRVARRQRLLPVALRRGGDPHHRRRRRVVDHLLRRRPRQPHRADPRDPLPAFAGPALLGLHLLYRLPGQQRRIQGDGPGPLRPAGLQGPDPQAPDRPQGRRLVPHGHELLQLLPGADDDLAEVRPALRRAAAEAGKPARRSARWTWPPRSRR